MLNPKRPVIKWVAVVAGLAVNPAFYLAYARSLLRRRPVGPDVDLRAGFAEPGDVAAVH